MASTLSALWKPTLASVALHLALVFLYVGKFHGDPSSLVCASRARAGLPPYEWITTPLGPTGHDGQFYYALARAPWQVHGPDLDRAPARHLRLLYPALCWLGSGGDPRKLLFVMPGVNLAVIAGLAALGGFLALRQGRSAWWGFLLPLAVNASLSLLHDLTDGLAILAVLGLLTLYGQGAGWGWVALGSLLALLTREQNVVVVLVVGGSALGRGRPKVVGGVLVALGLWGAWVGLLCQLYASWPFLPVSGNFDLPLAGLWYRWAHLGGDGWYSGRLVLIHAAGAGHLCLLLALAPWLAWRERGVVSLVLLAGVALALVGGVSIYQDFWSYQRVFVLVHLGVWLAGLRGGKVWPLVCLTPGLAWALVAARMAA